jgi:hypothetical protein
MDTNTAITSDAEVATSSVPVDTTTAPMPDTEVSISSAPVQDGKKYSIKVPGGGALSVVPGKYKNEEAHIRSWEHAKNQLWVAEANDGGFGFRNASSGKLLGVNKNGDIAVDADTLGSWERFKFQSVGSGYLFWVIYNGTQQYLYRPAQWDSLQISAHQSSAIALQIHEE